MERRSVGARCIAAALVIGQLFLHLPTYAGQVAGTVDLAGSFVVSESGDATYNLPITLPPGAGGVAPKIALSYNSQANNGLLGVGWALSGLSVISRCPRTVAQDGARGTINFDANDRFCLDGQRLIKVAGTAYGADGAEYRTERDVYSKVISYGTAGNGPAWFKVWTKSGQVFEYGNTVDSRIEAQGKTSARLWAVNKLSDTNGNYFTFSYFEDTTSGEYYPTQIDYTGNSTAGTLPNASVRFVYEARPDVLQSYYYGSSVKTSQRLKTVQTYAGTTPVREYRIAYQTGTTTGRSRIAGIAECELKGNTCKPGLVPTWSEKAAGFTAEPDWTTDVASFFADVDGDGQDDLISVRSDGIYVAISSGNSFGASTKWLPNFGTGQGYADANVTPVFVADVNGDGLADMVAISGTGSTYVYVALSNGTSFNTPIMATNAFSPTGGWTSMDTYPRMLADVNGDGLPDMVGFKNDGVYVGVNTGNNTFNGSVKWLADFGTSTATPYASSSANPRLAIDLNGDGFADIVGFSNSGVYVALGTGTAFGTATKWSDEFTQATGWTSHDTYPRTFGDVNGDGLPDLIGFKSDGAYVALNTGTGFGPATRWTSEFGTGSAIPFAGQKDYPRYMIDVNGDGRADIVGFAADGVKVALSTGTGFAASTQWVAGFGSAAGYGANTPRQLIDLDGDGSPDIVAVRPSGVSVARSTRTGPPDLITAITNGMGLSVGVEYRPLTDSTVYARGTGSVYPVANITAPVYVVASAKSPNGLGSAYTTNQYRYGSLKASYDGRGSLGFGWSEVTQVETNVAIHTDYRQDWPYSGLPLRVLKFIKGSNGFLSATTNTYACVNPASGGACAIAAGNRYSPYVGTSIEATWDTNGVALPVVTTTNTYDMYGNPTKIVVSTDDGSSKTTTNTYTNDATKWFLGRLTRTQVAATTGGTTGATSNGVFNFNDVIAANTNNYNLKSKAIAAGWNQTALLVANVTVNAGVTVGSTSTATAAFDTGTGYVSEMRLTLTNNGSIIGRGGKGADGVTFSTTSISGGSAGAGGAGLAVNTPITVINNGTIAGGGGGGGAGNMYRANVPWPIGGGSVQTAYAGSSGGGGGAGGGTGGAAGVASGVSLVVSGVAGVAGTLTTGGAGGGTASCWQYATLIANPGGAGGALGQAGSPGANTYGPWSIAGATPFGSPATLGTPGAGGPAVLNNIYINWTATGTRLGVLR